MDFLELLEGYSNVNVDGVRQVAEAMEQKKNHTIAMAFNGMYTSKKEAILNLKEYFTNESTAPDGIDVDYVNENINSLVKSINNMNEGDIKIVIHTHENSPIDKSKHAPGKESIDIPAMSVDVEEDEDDLLELEAATPKKKKKTRKSKKKSLPKEPSVVLDEEDTESEDLDESEGGLTDQEYEELMAYYDSKEFKSKMDKNKEREDVDEATSDDIEAIKKHTDRMGPIEEESEEDLEESFGYTEDVSLYEGVLDKLIESEEEEIDESEVEEDKLFLKKGKGDKESLDEVDDSNDDDVVWSDIEDLLAKLDDKSDSDEDEDEDFSTNKKSKELEDEEEPSIGEGRKYIDGLSFFSESNDPIEMKPKGKAMANELDQEGDQKGELGEVASKYMIDDAIKYISDWVSKAPIKEIDAHVETANRGPVDDSLEWVNTIIDNEDATPLFRLSSAIGANAPSKFGDTK